MNHGPSRPHQEHHQGLMGTQLTQQKQDAKKRDAGVEVGQIIFPEICGDSGIRPMAPEMPSLVPFIARV